MHYGAKITAAVLTNDCHSETANDIAANVIATAAIATVLAVA